MKIIIATVLVALVLGSKLLIADSSEVPSDFVLSNHQIIVNAAVGAHINPQELLAVAKCESTMNPKATNGASFGILQFIPSTFSRYSKMLNIQKPDIWSVPQQAYIASYMFSKHQERQWSCFTILKREGKI